MILPEMITRTDSKPFPDQRCPACREVLYTEPFELPAHGKCAHCSEFLVFDEATEKYIEPGESPGAELWEGSKS